jgi:hypothetical protein
VRHPYPEATDLARFCPLAWRGRGTWDRIRRCSPTKLARHDLRRPPASGSGRESRPAQTSPWRANPMPCQPPQLGSVPVLGSNARNARLGRDISSCNPDRASLLVREPLFFWRRRWRRRVIHNADSSSSLTSNSGAILREASMCCSAFALPNGQRSPTNWAGRTLPYGRTSPTRRASGLRRRLPEPLGAGVPYQTGGPCCLAARSLRVSYQTDGSDYSDLPLSRR